MFGEGELMCGYYSSVKDECKTKYLILFPLLKLLVADSLLYI